MAVIPEVVITMSGPGSLVLDQTVVSAAILAQTAALTSPAPGPAGGVLPKIHGVLNQVNQNTGDIADTAELIAKSLSNIEIALGSISIATSNQAVIQANLAASQIQKNNFDKQVTIDGMIRTGQTPPEMPSINMQLQDAMTNASLLQGAAWAQGAVINLVSEQGAALGSWIASTEAYTGVTTWIKKQRDQLFGPPKPSTPRAKKRATAGATGSPAIVE